MAPLIDVDNIITQLTTEEKILITTGKDFWHTFEVERLGIPSLKFSDGPNGIRGEKHFNSTKTACLPSGTGLASTWNKKLIYEVGELLAKESEAKGVHGILGPTINIARSPLGGRTFESFSEDPVLTGKLAAQYINGYQSSGLGAILKHFVCNEQEFLRFSSNSIVSQRALREIYLKPFEIAIKESNPKGIMTSYNKVNGIHSSENNFLLTQILRGEWGWKGLVMSDWTGTYSTSDAIRAGLDLEMPGPGQWRKSRLKHSLFSGKLSETTLDERVRNILNYVNDIIGSNSIKGDIEGERNTVDDQLLLRKVAGEAVVLLKNEDNILPLQKSKKTLVVGSNAIYTSYAGGGSSLVTPYYVVSPLEGIEDKIGKENVSYQIGTYSHLYLPTLVNNLRLNDNNRGVNFQIFNEPENDKYRQPIDELILSDINFFRMVDYKNEKLKSSIYYAKITSNFISDFDGFYEFGISVYGTAKLYINDELIIDNATHQTFGDSFYGRGTKEKRALYKVIKFESYKLRIEFGSGPTSPLFNSNEQFFGGGGLTFGGAPKIDLKRAIEITAKEAANAEQVILITGLNREWESEGKDRKDLKLPGLNDELVKSVLKSNSNAVIVVQAGSPVELPWVENAKALLYTSYGGNETGNAIADVLFGDVNPSGKLPLTFPIKLEDTPSYLYWGDESGRAFYGEDVFVGYRFYDTNKTPVNFPFGFGLSYSCFELSNLNIEAASNDIKISIQLTNLSDLDGFDVIQVYVGPEKYTPGKPSKELKDFDKIYVKGGTKQTLEFKLDLKAVTSYWDETENKWVSKKGNYNVIVTDGTGQENKKSFQTKKTIIWK